jgi:hypothetical protein
MLFLKRHYVNWEQTLWHARGMPSKHLHLLRREEILSHFSQWGENMWLAMHFWISTPSLWFTIISFWLLFFILHTTNTSTASCHPLTVFSTNLSKTYPSTGYLSQKGFLEFTDFPCPTTELFTFYPALCCLIRLWILWVLHPLSPTRASSAIPTHLAFTGYRKRRFKLKTSN